ncbi:MarR family transcriptional regulator [Sulfitobacter mediterraneus]|uniref:MarR family winged helix-turn-helix transcriptional regulator n=1 Tax=Sulfitobacter mediterraneus TaxID=83219 RepID=UPI0019329C7F|nr:MarR family transcriptional regulator [Sulfitobacter mediterraneus]MBM1310048.1 MarR family transcriptional regulator [Sulfitobacter mediterraneus]MBM1313932.1 MarR family transcriptional regulator [Sulfitobacter mediterraneus]MBM1322292.1 MarR family transcriptional regulator [Sulfitobacter mediterraneus]MBM1326204.1 MarR family transcriptional regulator [Sulfitobacter mediterraneus]MBM1397550.1 MarR family transcriptional regulator [Sulfitobacter mediterraneus]
MPTDNFELEEFLPYLLNQSAEVSSLAFQQVYKDRYGMLRTEWRVLFHLGLYGSMTASEIGGRARLHKTKISRAVQRLAERRFLTRTKDKTDRRVEHLALTAQGEAAYRDLRETARQYEQKLLSELTPQEGRVLRNALLKLSQVDPGRFT